MENNPLPTPQSPDPVATTSTNPETVSKAAAKTNLLVCGLTFMLVILALSHKCCAQEPGPSMCDLKSVVDSIRMIDSRIRTVRAQISQGAEEPSITESLDLFQRQPIWEQHNIQMPSLINTSRIGCHSIKVERAEYNKLLQLQKSAAKVLDSLLAILPAMPPNPVDTELNSGNVPQPEESESEYETKADTVFGKTIVWQEFFYDCSFANPKTAKIDFLWKDQEGNRIGSFDRAKVLLKQQGRNPSMLINAGIFDPNYNPVGLFYSHGKKLKRLNSSKGEGNFFLQPNGVFIIEKSGKAVIKTTQAYLESLADTVKIKHATQSGPMLLIDNEVNPAFGVDSKNAYIRHGVGIKADGTIVFVISREKVTFYQFAMFFKERLHCVDALYLDGAISKMYLPAIGLTENGTGFSGIISISK